MPATRSTPLQLLLAAVLAVTIALPDWISILHVSAGLWGTSGARWDDLGVDLDVFGFAYLAFAISIVGVITLVRAALSGTGPARALARKWMIATALAMVVFLLRMLIENGVGLDWAGVVGPLAAIGALITLRD